MKKTVFSLSAIALLALVAEARGIMPVGVRSASFDRHGDYMVVDMDLDLLPTDVESSRAQIITPLIVSERGDTVKLP